MEHKEAIKWIKEHHCPDDWYDDCKDSNAMRLAIKALEKQVPKKPIRIVYESTHDGSDAKPIKRNVCPSCSKQVFHLMDNAYCGGCGQRILWE